MILPPWAMAPIIPMLSLTIMSCQIKFFMYAIFCPQSLAFWCKIKNNLIITATGLLPSSVLENSTRQLARISVRLYRLVLNRQCGTTRALFRSPPNSKFFHFLSITSIFSRLHGALNVGKKNN